MNRGRWTGTIGEVSECDGASGAWAESGLTVGVQLQADQQAAAAWTVGDFLNAFNLSPPAAAATPTACQLQRALGRIWSACGAGWL
jgi:hypothetical protein